jgi:hypothetical protein
LSLGGRDLLVKVAGGWAGAVLDESGHVVVEFASIECEVYAERILFGIKAKALHAVVADFTVL